MHEAEERPLISLPLLAGLVIFVAGALSSEVLTDADSYWHVAAGRWMVEHGRIPSVDPFSHSMHGVAWTAHEWLAELLMYGTYVLSGWTGLQILVTVTYAVAIGYILRFLLSRMEPIHALAATALSASLMYMHFLARPHVIVWPLTALWVGELVNAGEKRRPPPWWLLVVLLLWVNLHASATAAIGFAVILAADAVSMREGSAERRVAVRQWSAFLVGACLCMLANPEGFRVFNFAAGLVQMDMLLLLVNEWRSANFQVFQFYLVWLLIVLALGCTGRLRLSHFRLTFLLGLMYLAFKHQRYHAYIGLLAPFILAVPLSAGLVTSGGATGMASRLDDWFQWLSRRAQPLGIALTIALSAVVAGIAGRSGNASPAPYVTPSGALAAFRSSGAKGHVLNAYSFGGFLIFNAVPVFVDGRADMYGDSLLRQLRDALELRSAGALDSLLSRYDIGWTMLEPRTAAVELLDHMSGWTRIYGDSVAIVHVRRDLLPARAAVRTNVRATAHVAAPTAAHSAARVQDTPSAFRAMAMMESPKGSFRRGTQRRSVRQTR